MNIDRYLDEEDGPSATELAAIEAEMPLIAAEVALVNAEIHVLCAGPHPSEVDWHRLRVAERRVTAEVLALVRRYGVHLDFGDVTPAAPAA